jgi:group I intron endonuclease
MSMPLRSFSNNRILSYLDDNLKVSCKVLSPTECHKESYNKCSESILNTELESIDNLDLKLYYDIISNFLKGIKIIRDSSSIITVESCKNFYLSEDRQVFRKKYSKVSGIYMLRCKLDDRLFYIGQAVDLSIRLGSHFSKTEFESTKLGSMIKLLGWKNFTCNIIETCIEDNLIVRENYYIKKYLPTLNGKFSSTYSNEVYRTLRSVLRHMQFNNRKLDPNFLPNGVRTLLGGAKDEKLINNSKIWAYHYSPVNTSSTSLIYKDFCPLDETTNAGDLNISLINNKPFENLRRVQEKYSIDARTIKNYADTYVPYNNLYFFTREIKDLSIISKRHETYKLIGLSNYLSKQIWAYESENLKLLKNKPFKTIKEVSLFIGTTRSTVLNILDRPVAMSKGFYCFTKELSEKEILDLKSKGTIRNPISSLSIAVWVYILKINSIELVNNKPFQSQQEMLRTLNLKIIRTINKYKDTGIVFRGFFFFSKKLSYEEIENLKKNIIYAKPNKKSKLIWVYKNNILINDTPFLSMISAAKELKLNRKLISKNLDSNIHYNDYLFYSNPLNFVNDPKE